MTTPVSDEVLTSLYAEYSSVWKVGEIVGWSGQKVHARLKKLGVTNPINVFTEAEKERLVAEYWVHAETGRLDELAKELGRTKQFLCRQAKALGLTTYNRKKPYFAVWDHLDEEAALAFFEKFKSSPLTMGKFCFKHKYDDLGFSRCMRKFFADEWDHVLELKQPKGSKYAIGRRFEYRVRDDLRSKGYFVNRSPASKSPVDLTAIKTGVVALIQCRLSAVLGCKDWNDLYDLAISISAQPVMASVAADKSIRYDLMLDRKDGSKKKQPMVEWAP